MDFIGAIFALFSIAVGAFMAWAAVMFYQDQHGVEPYLFLACSLLFFWYGGSIFRALLQSWSQNGEGALKLMHHGFTVGGKSYRFEDILDLNIRNVVTRKRLNFARSGEDQNVTAEIVVKGEAKPLKFVTGPAVRTAVGSAGQSASRRLVEKFNILAQNSVRERSNYAADLARWETIGRRLKTVTPDVVVAICRLRLEPSKYSIGGAAKAARHAASIAHEPLRTEAVLLAEELEQRSVSSSRRPH